MPDITGPPPIVTLGDAVHFESVTSANSITPARTEYVNTTPNNFQCLKSKFCALLMMRRDTRFERYRLALALPLRRILRKVGSSLKSSNSTSAYIGISTA